MLSEKFAKSHLSKEALELADIYNGYYCYEEDCLWAVPALELLDEFGDKIFAHCVGSSIYATKEGRMKTITDTLSSYYPEVLIAKGIQPDPELYARYLDWKKNDEMQNQRHPDLITSAVETSPGICQVSTAAGINYEVTTESYQAAKKKSYWTTLLSDCEFA